MYATTGINRHLLNATVLAISVAVLVWVMYGEFPRLASFVGKKHQESTVTLAQEAPGEKRQYSIEDIISAHLFGLAAGPPKPDVSTAPETKLRLSLAGLISSQNPRLARALIQVNSGQIKGYRIGDRIAGTDAQLQGVTSDKVLLNRNGNLESLAMKRKDLL